MENNIMIEEGIYIKKTPTVLDMDRISLLQKQLVGEKIGDIVFNLECMRTLLTNNTNEQIIDDVLNSDFDEETMKRITIWFEKLEKALGDSEIAKKKSIKTGGDTKTDSEKTQ